MLTAPNMHALRLPRFTAETNCAAAENHMIVLQDNKDPRQTTISSHLHKSSKRATTLCYRRTLSSDAGFSRTMVFDHLRPSSRLACPNSNLLLSRRDRRAHLHRLQCQRRALTLLQTRCKLPYKQPLLLTMGYLHQHWCLHR